MRCITASHDLAGFEVAHFDLRALSGRINTCDQTLGHRELTQATIRRGSDMHEP